ncbi:17 kDa surface antigen [Sphingomonas sp. LH128]|uniref:glycine zipper 2TM domain-containing protein n=1 Tax=Sphingomonas sp. LH128 TaxID=473781 RepID=UPI00027CAA94|nr:17 kDa surface antigen [Sphingomonas sp. LH128]
MKYLAGILGTLAASMTVASMPAEAQRYNDRAHPRNETSRNHRVDSRHEWRGDSGKNWDPVQSYHSGNYKDRRLSRNDRIYRGRDGRAYCRRSDGTTGLVIGALGGAALAKLVGGNTLGTLAGGAGGGLIGRQIDRGDVKCR